MCIERFLTLRFLKKNSIRNVEISKLFKSSDDSLKLGYYNPHRVCLRSFEVLHDQE
jgi:hypothetical protein